MKINFCLYCGLSALIGLGLLAGCGRPHVKELFCEPSFNQPAITKGEFLIGGITSIVGDREEWNTKWPRLDTLLWGRLAENLEGMKLYPVGYMASILGEREYNQLLINYEDTGCLEPDEQAILGKAFEDKPVYLIFVRFDEDRVFTDQTAGSEQSSGGKEITYTTFHRMGATFRIYSLPSCRLAWSGHLSGTEKSVNNYSENQGGIIGGLVDGILFGQSSSQPGYPDAPGFEVVAHHAFQSFAKTLKGIK